jgi:ketosteroid isomerase-like protein
MSHHEHPDVMAVKAMSKAMADGDFQKAAGYLANDVEWHVIGRAEAYHGMAGLQDSMKDYADSTITWQLHDVVGGDAHTIALGEATATRGGKTLTYRTAEIYHFKDGKVIERWAFSDDTQAISNFFA